MVLLYYWKARLVLALAMLSLAVSLVLALERAILFRFLEAMARTSLLMTNSRPTSLLHFQDVAIRLRPNPFINSFSFHNEKKYLKGVKKSWDIVAILKLFDHLFSGIGLCLNVHTVILVFLSSLLVLGLISCLGENYLKYYKNH